MPYESRAQEEFFNEHRGELKRQGVDVDEWNNVSKGLKLPNRAKPPKRGQLSQRLNTPKK
jgi:hypothetical protein